MVQLPSSKTDSKKRFNCSFCGKPQNAVRVLIDSPSSSVCDQCVGHFKRLLQSSADLEVASAADCEFCSFMHDEGLDNFRATDRKLFRSGNARICEACVDTCHEIVEEKYQDDAAKAVTSCSFCANEESRALVFPGLHAGICTSCIGTLGSAAGTDVVSATCSFCGMIQKCLSLSSIRQVKNQRDVYICIGCVKTFEKLWNDSVRSS